MESTASPGVTALFNPLCTDAEGVLAGEQDNGHVLPLALGFPFETTIARHLIVR
jgi:hypothetical protein